MTRNLREIEPNDSGATDLLVTGSRLNPIRAIRAMAERRALDQEARLDELTGQVSRKLIEGVINGGMVSVFHDRATDQRTTDLYTGIFTSPTINELWSTIWVHHKAQADGEKLSLSAYEHNPAHSRGIDLISSEGSDGAFRLYYRRSTDTEGRTAVDNWPIPEKIVFLEQILETDIDEEAMAEKFGSPYAPGDTWSSTEDPIPEGSYRPEMQMPGTSREVHHAYWVRDVYNQLPALIPGSPIELEVPR